MLKGEVRGKLREHFVMEASKWSAISNGIALLKAMMGFKVLD